MSRKIITNALQSPSLVGELKDYHKNMVNDVAKRGLLVMLSAALLVLQYASLAFPSSSTNSASISSDVIYGGISSRQDALLQYDTDGSMFKSALDALSISRGEVTKTNETSLNKWAAQNPGLSVSWSRSPIYKVNPGQVQSNNQSSYVATADSSFLYYGNAIDSGSIDKSNVKILAGNSSVSGSFAIIKDSGNVITASPRADRCYKAPNDAFSFVNCPNSNTFKSETTVSNLSYKTDARYLKNHPGDRLAYELKLTNQSQQNITLKPEVYLGDILEYSKLTSVDTARFDKNTEMLRWPSTTIAPGQEKTYSFDTQIFSVTPLVAYGQTNAASYDCYMSSLIGGRTDVKVSCPTPKIVEKMLSEPADSTLVVLAWLVFVINLLIYIKVRIYSKEHEFILKSMRSNHG